MEVMEDMVGDMEDKVGDMEDMVGEMEELLGDMEVMDMEVKVGMVGMEEVMDTKILNVFLFVFPFIS